jgi:phosphoglycolate phosphatase-like HAD superfamily hydrolase
MVKLTVFDLDNTLYDWVSYFVPSFRAMVEVLVREQGADEAELLAALRRVHQAQGTTEYAFALSELDVLHGIEESANAGGEQRHPAIAAFRQEAERRLRAYDDVPEVLHGLRREGRVLVAYTDAMATYADSRLEQLGLAEYFDELVATEDHAIPDAVSDFLSWLPPARFRERAVARHTPVGRNERKPSPTPLLRLLDEHNVRPHDVAFVGDSLTRDVAMAQRAGVHDIYAAYGRSYESELWEKLVAVTHWTEEDVAREQELAAHRARPTNVIARFAQLPAVLAQLDRAPVPVRG